MDLSELRITNGILLNFAGTPIRLGKRTYPTAEHLFQALKAVRKDDHEYVRKANTPKEAKRRGNEIKLRKDWEQIKYSIMISVLILKFTQNKDAREALLKTGVRGLVEYRPDPEWGRYRGKGKNLMGQALGQVRTLLQMGEQ